MSGELATTVRDAIFFSEDQASHLADRLRDAKTQIARGDFAPADFELSLAVDRAQRIVESLGAARTAILKARGGR